MSSRKIEVMNSLHLELEIAKKKNCSVRNNFYLSLAGSYSNPNYYIMPGWDLHPRKKNREEAGLSQAAFFSELGVPIGTKQPTQSPGYFLKRSEGGGEKSGQTDSTQKMNFDTDLTPFTKIPSKHVIDLIAKHSTVKLRENIIGENLDNFEYDDVILDTLKTQYTKEIIDNLDSIKTENCSAKNTVKTIRRQVTEKILAKVTSDTRLLFKICKDPLKFNTKNLI